AGCSRAQDPSGASPARSSARQTPGATDNTSPRSPRSGGLRPPCSGPAKPEHRLAAASQRSLQACIASLPLQSSWMSKTYLKSDEFNGGGSMAAGEFDRPISNEMLAKLYIGMAATMEEWWADLYHVAMRIRAREEGTPDPGTLMEDQTKRRQEKAKKEK